MQKANYFLLLILIAIASCNSSEYSPNQKFDRSSPTEVNLREIEKLKKKTPGKTIKIAVSGDTQRSYQQSIDFVNFINQRNDIDFVILNGDISDFGLLLEFNGVFKIYDRLNIPFISIIGNHDLVANGLDVYKRMFGPLNFTFYYGDLKFVCHDTNGREYNFDGSTPDMAWLKQHIAPDQEAIRVLLFSHVPPFDGDFDPKLSVPYQKLITSSPGVIASIHSHQHQSQKITYYDGTSIPFITTNAIIKRAFSLVKITDAEITSEEITF